MCEYSACRTSHRYAVADLGGPVSCKPPYGLRVLGLGRLDTVKGLDTFPLALTTAGRHIIYLSNRIRAQPETVDAGLHNLLIYTPESSIVRNLVILYLTKILVDSESSTDRVLTKSDIAEI